MENQTFAKICDFVFKWEGGLSNDANDAGGITNYGVSIVFLTDFYRRNREYCHTIGINRQPDAQLIRSISKSQARQIFYKEFWQGPKYESLPAPVAAIAFDSAVNCGIARANKFLQQGVNAISPNKLAVDGILGPKSRAALASASATLPQAIINARVSFYNNLASQKPSQRVFLKGWLNRTTDLKKFIQNNF